MEKRENLACVHVRLESGSDVLQAGKRQALRDAKIVLVGMTAHTAGGRPKVRLLALLVSSMGIALGLHTARIQLDRDPLKLPEWLDYLLSLAEAALAKMRALIFELRPESLEREGLVAALAKQGAALQARHDIVVQADLCEEPALPLTAKQELYRIAQEALHNTIKHVIRWAHFRAISVCARCRSVSATWVARSRSRALQGKGPIFSPRFHRRVRIYPARPPGDDLDDLPSA